MMRLRRHRDKFSPPLAANVPVPVGEPQTVRFDGHAGGLFILHYTHRVPNQHNGVGAGGLQVRRLHPAGHAAVVHLLGRG